jgi:hypothetical protein
LSLTSDDEYDSGFDSKPNPKGKLPFTSELDSKPNAKGKLPCTFDEDDLVEADAFIFKEDLKEDEQHINIVLVDSDDDRHDLIAPKTNFKYTSVDDLVSFTEAFLKMLDIKDLETWFQLGLRKHENLASPTLIWSIGMS